MNEMAILAMAFLLGAMITVYQPMNSTVSRIVGSPLLANVIFYFVALLAALAMLLLFGEKHAWNRIPSVPPVLFTTGVMSAFMVLGTIVLLPRMGARRLFLLQVSGQIIGAMIIGHFGLLGIARDPLNLKKLGGGALIILGAIVSLL